MSKPPIPSNFRNYKTADEALEAANRHIIELNKTLDSYWAMLMDGVDTQPRIPVQFEYRMGVPAVDIDLSKLSVGDKVKLRCGEIGEVIESGILTGSSSSWRTAIRIRDKQPAILYHDSGVPHLNDLKMFNNATGERYSIDDLTVESLDQHADWPETLKPDYDAFNAERLPDSAYDIKTFIQGSPETPTISEPVIEGGTCSVRSKGFLTEPIYVGLGAEITE